MNKLVLFLGIFFVISTHAAPTGVATVLPAKKSKPAPLASSFVVPEVETTVAIPKVKRFGVLSEGLRVELVKSSFSVRYVVNGKELKPPSDSLEQNLGLALGYSKISNYDFGYSAQFLYNVYADPGDDKFGAWRFSGNATYGFEPFYGFAGLNTNKYVSGDNVYKDLNWGLGYQFGLGMQFTPNVGLQLAYVRLNNKDNIFVKSNEGIVRNPMLELTVRGLEISLNGTF